MSIGVLISIVFLVIVVGGVAAYAVAVLRRKRRITSHAPPRSRQAPVHGRHTVGDDHHGH